MQVEHDIKIIPFDANFDKEVESMKKEGWRQAPGFAAFGVFPVVRDDNWQAQQQAAEQPPPQAAGMGGVATMTIDDSKVHIIRAGDKK